VDALGEIAGDSPGIRRLREHLQLILRRAATASRPPAILLHGETGTGKGLVVRAMHRAGPRAGGPFVDINCAAIPETLLEAELFGYERGAFTDARQAKPGLFQLAHRGMLFLDEVGVLSPALQAKLLKVLEDGAVRRLGGTRAEPIDVWIVSATNEDLAEAQRARRFREDLYHRLALLTLDLPPLRERGADVLLLAERFLVRACADYGLPAKTFARDARGALAAYGWPGNVRQLGNVVERVVLLADEPVVTAAMLALPVTTAADPRTGVEPPGGTSPRDQIRARLVEALTETGGNISQTAVRLGVARNTVLARMARFGLRTSVAADPARRDEPRRQPVAAAQPTDGPSGLVETSRPAWEPRRIALLRADADASRSLEEVVEKVQAFGGDIVELGPGVLVAAFGLEPVEDAPIRAALAALAIRKAAERAQRVGGAGPRVTIVVHVAQALVSQGQGAGTIDLKSKRTAWTTIDALVGVAEYDTIVVSETSVPFLERRFELVSAAAVDHGGVPFRRLMRREGTGFGLGGRPLSRFVGRDGELQFVTDRLARAARGQGQVVGIVGESGVGKSRFVYELTRLDAAREWRVLASIGVSHGSTTPFLPLSDLLRRYFAIGDADGPDAIRDKITVAVTARREELGSHLAPLLSLLDIPVDDPSWGHLDPPRQRRRIQDAVKRLLLHESRIRPLLLIFEDLHWVDSETQSVLDDLVESLPTARFLLAVNYRPEYLHGWGSKTYYSQLSLDALTPESAGAFLSAVLGEDPALEPLKQHLVRRGNPFFIEESIRALVETQALTGERGAYRLARPIQTIEVPATVQVILAARIERLPTEDKRLLQAASVIGHDVPVMLLHAVAEAEDDVVQLGLKRLQGAEFLYETRFGPDPEYAFKHALTHEVTYDTLPHDRRRLLHARVVEATERLYADRLTEHVERLAHHAVNGGLREKAVGYLQQAGLKASAKSALADARTWFEHALGVLATLPESRTTREQTFEILFQLRPVLSQLGEVRRSREPLLQAATLAEALNDDHRRARVSALLSDNHMMLGELDKALVTGTHALEIAGRLGDSRLHILAASCLLSAHYARGDYERVIELATGALAASPAEWTHENFGFAAPVSVKNRTWLVMSLAERGRFREAAEHASEAIRLAEPTEQAYTVGLALLAASAVHLLEGDWAKVRPLVERAIALSRAGNVVLYLPRAVAGSALALAQLGEENEALNRLREGERLVDDLVAKEMTWSLSLACQWLGRACLRLGRPDEARRLGDRALESAQGQPGFAAHALQLLGDVATHPDRFDAKAGEAHYRQALALAEPRNMSPLVAHCHLGIGKLHRRTGNREHARERLTTATSMYREMDMRFWGDEAEAETTATVGPAD
jgi:transcriptional regulator with AAA-type ATPase domain/tetratricopeptide (TPR) repeat protein